MKYTKYFSGLIKNIGVPHLSPEQMKRMMNIVHLEGRKEQLEILKRGREDSPNYKMYDFQILTLSTKITVITSEHSPEKLMEEMINSSKEY